MAIHYFLPPDGAFYKANLHCHSTLSDGRFTVEELKELYTANGYHIIAYSDHNILIPHMELADEHFIPLTSIEININRPGTDATYHLNFFSKDPYASQFIDIERIYDTNVINDIIRRARDAGFLAQYNHPRWSMQTPADFTPLENLFGFEMFNTGCEYEMHDGYGDYEYELYCRTGKSCVPVATDDNHNVFKDPSNPNFDSFGGFTMIKAPSLTYANIIEAMEKGDCYGSTGPLISQFFIDGNRVHVECSPARSILLRSDTRQTMRCRSNEDTLTEADFDIPFDYQYLRLEVMDLHGRKAMTRAYFKNE